MTTLIFMTLIFLSGLFFMYLQQKQHQAFIEFLNDEWKKERKELFDRIQAPTFGEYKQAEIKMVKAQKEEEPKPSFVLE